MVFITNINKMFWGVTIDAGKRYSQTVQQGFHVSMAALEISAKKPSENVQVMLQRDSTEYLLCTLHNNLLQQPLDLNFATGEEVSFSLNGAGVVHLTGYLIFDDEPSVSEFSDDEEAPSLVDSSGDGQMIGLKRKAVAPVGDSKKIKLLDALDDDDDDEDDEDYSEEEEGFSEDDDDDSDLEDEFFDEDDSFDDDEDDSDDEEAESPEKKAKAGKTPTKSPKVATTPASQKNKKQEANVSKQEKTPKQQGSAKQNGKSPKLNTSTPAQQKAPETPATPSGETESAKKKKKRKKKNKSENNSMNASNSSTPGTPATPGTPSTPNKSVSTPSGTPKKKVVAGGTIVEDLKAGHGPEAKPGKMVSVYYVGTLAKTNKRFDSCTEGKPFRFRLNQGEVIKGWDVGLTGMKVGGKRKITVPPSQGYGNNKQGPIPPNSTLVFEVELKAVS